MIKITPSHEIGGLNLHLHICSTQKKKKESCKRKVVDIFIVYEINQYFHDKKNLIQVYEYFF